MSCGPSRGTERFPGRDPQSERCYLGQTLRLVTLYLDSSKHLRAITNSLAVAAPTNYCS